MFGLDSPSAFLVGALLLLSVSAMLLEVIVNFFLRKQRYGLKDTLANVGMYAGFIVINGAWLPLVWLLYTWAQGHALWQPTLGAFHFGGHGLWWEWILLIVFEDFCFYWFHRASHRINLLWASHVTHHSSRHFNLTVALRQTWLPFLGVIFWLPLGLVLGFDPLMIMTVQTLSLFYQDLLHTEFLPRLGPLEWIFNTPTHHQVHHGSNAAYIDKNYAGVLIIWDRMFGTYAKKQEPVKYGLTKDLGTHNPIVIAFHEWAAIARRLFTLRGVRAKVTAVLGRPEQQEALDARSAGRQQASA